MRLRWCFVPAGSGSVEPGKVIGPEGVLLTTQAVQQIPGIDTADMAIRKSRLDGVMPNLLNRNNRHLALADLKDLLTGAMALHLGRRRKDAQKFGRQAEHKSVAKLNFKHTRNLVQNNSGWNKHWGRGHGGLG